MQGNSPAWSNSASFLFEWRACVAKWKGVNRCGWFIQGKSIKTLEWEPWLYSFAKDALFSTTQGETLWMLNSFCTHKRNCIYKREMGGKGEKKKVEFIDTHVWLLNVVMHVKGTVHSEMKIQSLSSPCRWKCFFFVISKASHLYI